MKEQALLTNGAIVFKEEFTTVTYELNKLWDYNKDLSFKMNSINRESVGFLFNKAKGKSDTIPLPATKKNILEKILKDSSLINEDGSISKGTKNIVLTMQLQSGNLLFPSKTISFPNATVINDALKDKTEVTLTNGITIYKNDFSTLERTLTSINHLLNGSIEGVSRDQSRIAVTELYKKANKVSHDISGDASKTLKRLGLIRYDGEINDPIHNIVRCSIKEAGNKLLLVNPIKSVPSATLSNTSADPAIIQQKQAKL